MSAEETRDDLTRRLKTLSERLWEGRCKEPDIAAWLNNFDGRHCDGDSERERLHALHLLAHVSYFGLPEIRVLLRAMYRDLFRYPIIQKLRSDLGGTRDAEAINGRFAGELDATRFVGMGSPAESGTHLLYYFRQENQLSASLFINQPTDANVNLSGVKRLVFIEDFCGSGKQSVDYSHEILGVLDKEAKLHSHRVEYFYFVLFGTADGLAHVRSKSRFDIVEAVGELDATDKTFGDDARIFRRPPIAITAAMSKQIAFRYGRELYPQWPLGYDDSQLLLAFHHNIPDNSLPILWSDESDPVWTAIFPRHPKIY